MSRTRLLLVAAAVILITNKVEAYAVASTKCPENEFYTDCGDNCQTECATLNQPCTIRHVKCPAGCYCNRGFARDASGKCVEIGHCVKNWSLLASRTY